MKTLEYNGRKLDLSKPVVMGILNLTPDSFYEGSRAESSESLVEMAGRMLREGAAILDLGAVSTRPGSAEVDEEEELLRLLPALRTILTAFPDCLVSVDTCRPTVARIASKQGVFMINDIYGGTYDEDMIPAIAALNIPYVIMHMKGTPATMQQNPQYGDVVGEIAYFFEHQVSKLRKYGFRKIVLDPGFGFGKSVSHNFEILSRLEEFVRMGYPVMAGLSRKSMINKVLGTKPPEALNGTTVLNTLALLNGAGILRVHDVKEAVETVKLVEEFQKMNIEK
jgi:dihydropteroate synthase